MDFHDVYFLFTSTYDAHLAEVVARYWVLFPLHKSVGAAPCGAMLSNSLNPWSNESPHIS